MKNRLKEILISCMKENVSFPESINTSDVVPIMGCNSFIDSLDLLSILVSYEDKIQEHFGYEVVFANEKAMSLKNSPFKNTETLVDYSCALIKEASIGEA